ncbi:type B DNA-directed DNA polymerase, partial [Candidatus Bathyarchaeota archaeon]
YWYKPKSKDKSLPEELRHWYKVVQLTLKVILNASYGVFGADIFEFYCPPVAGSKAAIGRHAIKSVIEKCHELGMEVLYGDTDSVFLKEPSEEQVKALMEWADQALGLDLDVDKVYRYVVFSERKKNYLGVLTDGTVDVKGLMGKKRHVPKLIKEAFARVVEELAQVRGPEDLKIAKERIKAILREYYERLKNRQFELADLAFHVTLGKEPEKYTKTTPQHVKAAKELERRTGRKLKAGDIISFVKVSPRRASDGSSIDVLPVELATKEDVDIDKYISFLESTFEQILDALGMSFSEVIGLTKLESFMS